MIFSYHKFHSIFSHGIINISCFRTILDTNEEKVSSASTLSLFGGTVDNIDMFLTTSFSVGADFGRPGAILLESYDNNEFYMKSITLEMPDNTQIYFPFDKPFELYFCQPRIFFTNDVSCILSPLSSLSFFQKLCIAQELRQGHI